MNALEGFAALSDTRGSQKYRAHLARAVRIQGIGQDHLAPAGELMPHLYAITYIVRPDHIALASTGCISASCALVQVVYPGLLSCIGAKCQSARRDHCARPTARDPPLAPVVSYSVARMIDHDTMLAPV